MGMFDSFYLRIVCPNCRKEQIAEFQTKQFDCTLMKWHENTHFTSESIYIYEGVIKSVYGDCKECDSSLLCDVIIKDGRVFSADKVRVRY